MTAANPAHGADRAADDFADLEAGAETNAAWHERFSRDEISSLLELSDLRGAFSIALNWGLIAAAMTLAARWPNPLTLVLALFVIGARQLALAVLMHEASHRTMFRDKKVNDWVCNWLCAYPVWSDLHTYRPYHLQHHAKNWTAEDPDRVLVEPFPTTRASLRRKVWRDLSGQTGWKFAQGAWKRSFERWRAGDPLGRRAFVGVALTNTILLVIVSAMGAPWLYLLWAVAWLTTYPLVTRIRSIAEHAMVPDPADPLRNTRTTYANLLERLFLAPNRVNYHLEHHLLMTVPHYRLPAMHRLLKERGLLDQALVTKGYRAVLERASSLAPGREAEIPKTSGPPPRVPPF